MKKFICIVAAAVPLSLMFASAAHAAPRAPEHITITIDLTAPQGTPSPLTATGPISGTGTDTQTSDRPTGTTDHEADLVTLDDGTLNIKNTGVGSNSLDATTCTITFNSKGIWTITSGTGAYAHAKGHGHFVATGTLQGTPDPDAQDGCNFDAGTGSITINATGDVSL